MQAIWKRYRDHFFLFGPRETGKSTWLRQAFSSALLLP
jgi:predicted AAA+ superfamily ATPase